MSLTHTRAAVLPQGRSIADDISLVVIGSAVMAVCAHVSFPLLFSPVPITLQTFGVILIALTLGPVRGAFSLALYLAEGAVGLPVFSPAGPGGIAQLIGPTGGFLLSYPLAAYVIGSIARLRPNKFFSYLGAVGGELVLFTIGAVWLKLVLHVTFAQAFTMAVLPFLPGEVIKIVVASAAGERAGKWLARLQG